MANCAATVCTDSRPFVVAERTDSQVSPAWDCTAVRLASLGLCRMPARFVTSSAANTEKVMRRSPARGLGCCPTDPMSTAAASPLTMTDGHGVAARAHRVGVGPQAAIRPPVHRSRLAPEGAVISDARGHGNLVGEFTGVTAMIAVTAPAARRRAR